MINPSQLHLLHGIFWNIDLAIRRRQQLAPTRYPLIKTFQELSKKLPALQDSQLEVVLQGCGSTTDTCTVMQADISDRQKRPTAATDGG
jgi:hypothetical protein